MLCIGSRIHFWKSPSVLTVNLIFLMYGRSRRATHMKTEYSPRVAKRHCVIFYWLHHFLRWFVIENAANLYVAGVCIKCKLTVWTDKRERRRQCNCIFRDFKDWNLSSISFWNVDVSSFRSLLFHGAPDLSKPNITRLKTFHIQRNNEFLSGVLKQ